jgi:RecB family exonuclease
MIEDYFNDQDSSMQTIKSGSHSRLVTFEQCKYRAKLAYIDRIPEPARPLRPGQTEHANDRGTRVHEAAEKFVEGGVELIQELKFFEPELIQLREMRSEGKVTTEGEWAYNRKWAPVAWRSYDAWMRIKCDTVAFMSPKYAVVIDYKTGKRYGNEFKHAEQMQLYQLGAFIRYPKLEKITVELWYTDQNEIARTEYRRDQGLRFVAGVEKRMDAMTSETDFMPNPNAYNCRWCPYKPEERGGTGHCSVGV